MHGADARGRAQEAKADLGREVVKFDVQAHAYHDGLCGRRTPALLVRSTHSTTNLMVSTICLKHKDSWRFSFEVSWRVFCMDCTTVVSLCMHHSVAGGRTAPPIP